MLTEKAFFYSTAILITFTVFRIANFITEFFKLSGQEMTYKSPSGDTSDGEQADFSQEKAILKNYLLSHSLQEIDTGKRVEFLDGELWMSFRESKTSPEAWFNIWIQCQNPTVLEIRNEVCVYSYKLLALLDKSMVDLNSFVLSFNIEIGDEESPSRNLFFRTNRGELRDILPKESNPIKAVLSIKNKLFDELFRNLD